MLNRSGCVFGLFWRRSVTFLGLVSFNRGAPKAAFATTSGRPTFTAWAPEATLAALSLRAATATHHLTHALHRLDVFVFGDRAVAINVHTFKVFLGIAKHAASALLPPPFTTGASRTTRAHTWAALTIRATTFGAVTIGTTPIWTISITTWGTTEAAITAGGATTFTAGAAHPLPFLTTAHVLRDAGNLCLINEAVVVGVHLGEAIFGLTLAHVGKFILADLAVAVCVSTLDKLGKTIASIPTTGRAALGPAGRSIRFGGRWRGLFWRRCGLVSWRRGVFGGVLGTGEAGQAEETEAVEECLFKFHSVRMWLFEARVLKQACIELVAAVVKKSCKLS